MERAVWGVPLEPGERVVFFQRDDPGWQKPALIVAGLLTLAGIIGFFLLLAGVMARTTCTVVTTRRFLLFDGTPRQARHEEVAKIVRHSLRGRVHRYELQDVQRRALLVFDVDAAPAIAPLLERWLTNRNVLNQVPEVPFEPVHTRHPVVGSPRRMPAGLRYSLLALGGLASAYLAGVLVVAVVLHRHELAAAALRARAVELGEQHAPLPDHAAIALGEACAGKLERGEAGTIAAFVARMEPAGLPQLADDGNFVDRVLVGLERRDSLDLDLRRMDESERPPRPLRTLEDALDLSSWSRYLHRDPQDRPVLAATRYLVAARYAWLELPQSNGEGYSLGAGDWGARVVSFPEGEVLCEGRGSVRIRDTFNTSYGTANADSAADSPYGAASMAEFLFTRAVAIAPLHAVCRAGGPQLCAETASWVGYQRN